MAAAAAMDYVMFEGARLPLFAERHLRTLDRIRLHEHAQLIYRTLGSRYGILAPELYDGDLADWILQVQGKHLEPLKTKTSYMDAYGDTVTKTTSTDVFGDRKTTRTVRDALGDTSKTTTTDIFGDRRTTTSVRDAFGDTYKTSTFEAPADVVVFGGAQLPVLVESHLRALDRARLREHAQLIYRSLSGRLQILDPMLYGGDLVDWVLQLQGRHLDPLRTTVATAAALGSPMAAAAAMDYVMFEGARLPFFAERHLRTLDRIRLREHAQLIYRTLGSRYGILAPELYDGDLAEWILQVQGRHLEPLKTKTSYMDAYGDKVTKTTSTDIFGDRKTTTSVRDVFGDTSK